MNVVVSIQLHNSKNLFIPWDVLWATYIDMTSSPSHLRDPFLGPDVVGVLRELVDQLLHLDVELDGAGLDRFVI